MVQYIRRNAWLLPLLLVAVLTIAIVWKFLKPGAPTHVVMATGAQGGAYAALGKKYAEILARDGVMVQLITTKGSVDNLARLREGRSAVEIAFLQSGVAGEVEREDLRSLGSLFYEPLWVFYRTPANKPPMARIGELSGRHIAIGGEGSGTRPVSLALLKANAITAANTRFNDAPTADASLALLRGELDAVFMVAAADSPLVQELLAAPGIRLMNMATAAAYSRLIPTLTKITMPRGVMDLTRDIPSEDVQLVAATATLVAVDSLHPAIAYLFVKAAKEIHEGGSRLHAPREFPNVSRFQEFTVPENVALLYKDGTPFMYRHLPFWVANLVQRLWVLLIPLVAILISASDALPKLLGYRMSFRIMQIYRSAHSLESDIIRVALAGEKVDPTVIDAFALRLTALNQRTDQLTGPAASLKSWYELRGHLALVGARLAALRAT